MLIGKRIIKQQLVGKVVPRMSIIEAKRQHCPYEALLAELYIDNCTVSATHLKNLICEEEYLFNESLIKVHVKNNKALLMTIFNNCKLAEQSSKLKQCLSRKATYELLYQALHVISKAGSNYAWLERSFFEIIVDIANKYGLHDNFCSELRAKIYCKYALRHMKTQRLYEKGIENFNKALSLARAKSWQTDNITNVFNQYNLHEFIVINLGKLLTQSALTFLRSDPERGIEQASRAIKTVAEADKMIRKVLIIKALLVKAQLLIEVNNFAKALKKLIIVEHYVMDATDEETEKVQGELNMYKGMCYSYLDYPDKALEAFSAALLIARKLQLTELTGVTLLQLAKIYMRNPIYYSLAHKVLLEARLLFAGTQESQHKKMVKYLLGSLDAHSKFSSFNRLIKNSNLNYCDLFAVRIWKSQLKHFRRPQSPSRYLDTSDSAVILSSLFGHRLMSTYKDAQNSNYSFNLTTTNWRERQCTTVDRIQCLLDDNWREPYEEDFS